MIFTDVISKRNSLTSTEVRRLSLSDETQRNRWKSDQSTKHHNNQKTKTVYTSVLNLLHIHQPTDNLENNDSDHQQQQQQPCQPRRSIIKASDIERVLAKKSVTFASVFDTVDNENDPPSKCETLSDNEAASDEDLVTVITNKQIDDQLTIDTNENIEPYPFRSEIPVPLTPQSDLSMDTNTSIFHQSRKKLINHFIPPHRPKKLRHPIQITDPLSLRNRSNSAPNLRISSLPPATNNSHRPVKTRRTWFKSSSIVQFFRLFGKRSHKKQKKEMAITKINPHRQSPELRRLSEPLY